jgi:hypothetical protein
VHLAPHETLWLPVNVSLGGGGLCRECSAFSNAEHIVYATAELQTVEFENGALAMEFAAPAPAEAVLQLARRPADPTWRAAIHGFDFDEKTLRVRLKIPQGKGPASLVRVALAIERRNTPPSSRKPSAWSSAGNTVSTSYSSEQLADRSRLRLPEGFAAKATRKSPLEIDYAVDVPADALHGDWANLAIEADGVPLGRAHLQLFRPASVHLPKPSACISAPPDLAVEPPSSPSTPRPAARWTSTCATTLRKSKVTRSIPRRGLSIPAAQNGTEFRRVMDRDGGLPRLPRGAGARPARLGSALLRRSEAGDSRPISGDPARPGGGWSADLDGDGSPEWVLENQKARAVFSAQDGGRWLEFVWKDSAPNGLNVLPESGALAGTGPVEVHAGDGALEFTGKDWKRTVRLAGAEAQADRGAEYAVAAETLETGKHNEITDRAAIYTTSGRTTLDFTDDRAKLHATLLRITPQPIARASQLCPDISYYQADLIVNQNDPMALCKPPCRTPSPV